MGITTMASFKDHPAISLSAAAGKALVLSRREMPKSVKRVAKALARRGFAHLDDKFFGVVDPKLKASQKAFVQSCFELPRDEDGGNNNRNRRYGTFVLLPWNLTLQAVAAGWGAKKKRLVSKYFQSSKINPENGGKTRSFAPLTEEQQKNAFLKHAIMTCFRSLRWKYPHQPVAVGVHLIQL